jgi:hypothetical protein
MALNIPELTPLNCTVLAIIGSQRVPGKVVREELKNYGHATSLPSFYNLMARLEAPPGRRPGYVRGDYEKRIINGQAVKERYYELTVDGHRVLADTLEFYSRLAERRGHLVPEG